MQCPLPIITLWRGRKTWCASFNGAAIFGPQANQTYERLEPYPSSEPRQVVCNDLLRRYPTALIEHDFAKDETAA